MALFLPCAAQSRLHNLCAKRAGSAVEGMASEERNFRSYYYEKVGFRGVEEKKSLEILLKEKPLSRLKLTQFILRFPVPGIYRIRLWKILLGVVPVYTDSEDFVLQQQKEQFDDLTHALEVMRKVSPETPKFHQLVIMWLLEEGKLKFNISAQLEEAMNQHLLAVAEALSELCDSDFDVYWIAKGLYDFIDKVHKGIARMVEHTEKLLQKEDSELFNYLLDIHALSDLPFQMWFLRCFAGTLTTSALERIWDKVVGGCSIILVYVAVCVLTTTRRAILSSKSSEKILECLHTVSEETGEVVATKAIDLWQKHGSPQHVPSQDSSRGSRH